MFLYGVFWYAVTPVSPALNRLLLAGALALALPAMPRAGRQGPAGTDELLAKVGDRIADFYRRAKNVICVETSTVQDIDLSSSTIGFARTVESELHIDADGEQPGAAALVRKVRRINGRVPRERDSRDRQGCTDPNPLSVEPLAFVLPARRPDYRFTAAGVGTERNQRAVMIDFISANRKSSPLLIEDPSGRDNCFDWSGHIASRGRMWVDAATLDVLRVDRSLLGPVEVRVPTIIQRRYRLDNWVVIARDDLTIRYQRVVFKDPDEVLLLPESIQSHTIIRGGLQSTRRWQAFSDYRRFVTGGRVVD